jgi:acetyltransferase-like isoleucine patch superfamily enzyme
MSGFLLKRRRFIRTLYLPLEFLFRLQRKLSRFVLNNAQLSAIQQLGKGFSCGIYLSIQNDGVIEIGDEFQGANFLQLSTYSKGALRIGDRCFFGDNCKIIADNSNISIGDDCLVAEHVSIRVSNHGTKIGCVINKQPNASKGIIIGSDVWIGKGVIILAGSEIPDGVVIGANSVVIPGFEFEAYCIYAGNPIRRIRARR